MTTWKSPLLSIDVTKGIFTWRPFLAQGLPELTSVAWRKLFFFSLGNLGQTLRVSVPRGKCSSCLLRTSCVPEAVLSTLEILFPVNTPSNSGLGRRTPSLQMSNWVRWDKLTWGGLTTGKARDSTAATEVSVSYLCLSLYSEGKGAGAREGWSVYQRNSGVTWKSSQWPPQEQFGQGNKAVLDDYPKYKINIHTFVLIQVNS